VVTTRTSLLLALFVAAAAAALADTEQEGSEREVPAQDCHPSYSGCLDAKASDYDCIGGSGNGPRYTGRVRVLGPDVFQLDADGDGWGCE
jgi:hypothetical protein